MTEKEREPFARVVENTNGSAYLVVGKDWPCGEAHDEFEILGLEEGAQQINAAVESYAKQAVERFRERAVAAFKKGFEENWLVEEMLEAIRNLPPDDGPGKVAGMKP